MGSFDWRKCVRHRHPVVLHELNWTHYLSNVLKDFKRWNDVRLSSPGSSSNNVAVQASANSLDYPCTRITLICLISEIRTSGIVEDMFYLKVDQTEQSTLLETCRETRVSSLWNREEERHSVSHCNLYWLRQT